MRRTLRRFSTQQQLEKFVGELRNLPPRSGQWVGRPGPVAWMSVDSGFKNSGRYLTDAFFSFTKDGKNGSDAEGLRSNCDFYAQVTAHSPSDGAVECPPPSVTLLPVLNTGQLDGGAPEATSRQLYQHTVAASATLVEKGYVPIVAGGDSGVVLPVVEGINQVIAEDIVFLHFGCDTLLGPAAPLRVLLEKRSVKGLVQLGARAVSSEARQARKNFQVKYVDANSMFLKGMFTVKDMRNDLPIFIGVDLGVLDPAFAPGVPVPESGGLSVRELLHFISVIRGPRVVGMSVFGYNPALDVYRGAGAAAASSSLSPGEASLTATAGSKIAKELIMKAYSISTMTAAQGMAYVNEQRKQGNHPESYPD